MSYPQQQQRPSENYVRSSGFTKALHYADQIDPQTQKPVRQQVELEPNITEEFSISLTPQKAQDLLNRIAAATQDQAGTGGIRMTFYCRKATNKQTGEIFDGASFLVYASRPSPEQVQYQQQQQRPAQAPQHPQYPRPQQRPPAPPTVGRVVQQPQAPRHNPPVQRPVAEPQFTEGDIPF